MDKQSLKNLKRSYLMCKSFNHLKELFNPNICLLSMKMIINCTLQLSFQPPTKYQISFVKSLIKDIERQRDIEEFKEELLSLLYEELERISSNSKLSNDEQFYRLYEIEDHEPPVKIFENEISFVANGTTGLVTWEASTNFIEWIIVSNDSFNPKWIFELGSGTGHLGICLKKLLKDNLNSYEFSDGSACAVKNIERNLKENFSESQLEAFHYFVLDWANDGPQFEKRIEELIEEFGNGVLVGSDIIFDPELLPSLIQLFHLYFNVISKKNLIGQIYLSCTIRNECTFKEALKYFDNSRISAVEVHSWANGSILLLTAGK